MHASTLAAAKGHQDSPGIKEVAEADDRFGEVLRGQSLL
jgi:hypothetical protein